MNRAFLASTTRRLSLAAVLAVGLAAWSTPDLALAQSDESKSSLDAKRAKAAARFERGVTLFENGAYRAALIEFQRAYETLPDFRLLYNVGQTHMLLQEHLEATRAFEGYLVEGADKVPPQRREQVEAELVKLREFVAFIAVRANVPGAQVFVDDKEVGIVPLDRPVAVNLGRHRITVNSADGRTATQVVDVAAGDVVELELELEASADGGGSNFTSRQKASIALMSGGAALLAGAVVTGVLQLGAQSDYETELDRRPGVASSLNDAENKARTMAIFTDVLGGAGLAVAAAGVVLWFMGDSGDEKQEPAVAFDARVGPNGAFAQSRIRF